MRQDDHRLDTRRRHDTTCRTCGTPVAAPVFFDTRGHHYCSPDCGENVGLAHAHAHLHAHGHAPAAMEMR
ncbi:hypothetical protein [Rhodoplanes sp. SY1]|uniref:hypothetical protein n=1 Tax=Rhodoplanes sp. SY1 TaxID=3166646 RepID=UPI0038B53A82